MSRNFSLVFSLLVLLVGIIPPCFADSSIRPLEVGNGFAVWQQQTDGTNVLRLRNTDNQVTPNSANIGGGLIEGNARFFGSLDFDLTGAVTLLCLGNFYDRQTHRRITDQLFRLPIRIAGTGFRRVRINNGSFNPVRGERVISANFGRRDPIVLAGTGRIRFVKVNGRESNISFNTATAVPGDLFAQRTIEMEPIVIP